MIPACFIDRYCFNESYECLNFCSEIVVGVDIVGIGVVDKLTSKLWLYAKIRIQVSARYGDRIQTHVPTHSGGATPYVGMIPYMGVSLLCSLLLVQ